MLSAEASPAPGGALRTPVASPIAAPSGAGRVAGGTTSQPVSSDPVESTRRPHRPVSKWWAIGGAVTLLAVGGEAIVMRTRGGVTAAHEPVAAPSAAASQPFPPPHEANVPSEAPSASATAVTPAAPPASVSDRGASHGDHGASHGDQKHSSPVPAAKPSPAVAPSTRPASPPTCRAVPYFDSDGEQHFKQECQ